MKYISVDLEFTNLNIEESQILEFAAIIEDTTKKLSYEDCPKFHCYINQKNIKGDIIALGMNIDNIKLLYDYNLIKNIQQKKEYKLKYNILNDVINGRSLGVGYGWEDLGKSLFNPGVYYGNNNVSTPLDIIIDVNNGKYMNE
jgi:hypothetical protein